jgi:hypothetical protein
MKKRREMVLKAFLSRQPPERMAALQKFLPEEEQLVLSELPIFGEIEETAGGLLEQVHWSWFLPTLKSYPEKEQRLFLHAMGGGVERNLRHELGLGPDEEPLSESGRSFLRQVLQHSLVGPEERLIPIEYLPPSSLNVLLRMGKKELTRLIERLSLYDLAHELRQIVETKILKKIYSFLSDEEKKFLKTITAQKEPYPIPRVGLDRWDGTEESFRMALHRRGLARLGAALSGQDPDLIWYVCHQLDIGRGSTLFKLCAKEAMPGFTDWVARQVDELLNNPEMLQ